MEIEIPTWEEAKQKWGQPTLSTEDLSELSVASALENIREFWRDYYLDLGTSLYGGLTLPDWMMETEDAAEKHRHIGNFLLHSIHPQDRPLMAIMLVDDLMTQSRKRAQVDRVVFSHCNTIWGLPKLPNNSKKLSEEENTRRRYNFVAEWLRRKRQETDFNLAQFFGFVVCKELEIAKENPSRRASQISYIIGTARKEKVSRTKRNGEIKEYSIGFVNGECRVISRAHPESFSIKGDGSTLALLWLLKNPGYGENLVKALNNIPLPVITNSDWLPETKESILEDQLNLAHASITQNGRLPWEPLNSDPEGQRRKGWYRERAFHLLTDTDNTPRTLLSKEWVNASSLGRIEFYPYRSLESGDMPPLLNALNASGLFLPSQQVALELLTCITFYDNDIFVVARDEDTWMDALRWVMKENDAIGRFPSFALKFISSSNVALTKGNLSLNQSNG